MAIFTWFRFCSNKEYSWLIPLHGLSIMTSKWKSEPVRILVVGNLARLCKTWLCLLKFHWSRDVILCVGSCTINTNVSTFYFRSSALCIAKPSYSAAFTIMIMMTVPSKLIFFHPHYTAWAQPVTWSQSSGWKTIVQLYKLITFVTQWPNHC